MRISQFEHEAIVTAVKAADPDAHVYLFGSRVDDTKKGGDIDLLVFSQRLGLEDKLRIRARLQEIMGEQKIDIVIALDATKPFVKLALSQGIEL